MLFDIVKSKPVEGDQYNVGRILTKAPGPNKEYGDNKQQGSRHACKITV